MKTPRIGSKYTVPRARKPFVITVTNVTSKTIIGKDSRGRKWRVPLKWVARRQHPVAKSRQVRRKSRPTYYRLPGHPDCFLGRSGSGWMLFVHDVEEYGAYMSPWSKVSGKTLAEATKSAHAFIRKDKAEWQRKMELERERFKGESTWGRPNPLHWWPRANPDAPKFVWDAAAGARYRGRAIDDSVYHIHVLGEFKAGRIVRHDGEALCKSIPADAFVEMYSGLTPDSVAGSECPKCLAILQRHGLSVSWISD